MTQSLQEKLAAQGVEWVQIPLPKPLKAEDMWNFPEDWNRVPNEVLGLPADQPGPDVFASTTPHEGFSANACAQTFLLRGNVELLTLMDGVHDQLPPDATTESFNSEKLKTTDNGVTTRTETVYSAAPQGETLTCKAVSYYDLVRLSDGKQYILLQRTVTARVDDPAELPTFNDALQGS